VKNPIRNETSLVLVVAVIFSAIAIPVLSGFLEPSQPPAVATVQIGEPGDGAAAGAREDGARAKPRKPDRRPKPETREPRPAGNVKGQAGSGKAQRRRPAPEPVAPAPPAQSAPSVPSDDAAEDDGGED
jgi:hypothetical protein